MVKNIAIILAGGSGHRFDSDRPKQFADIGGHSMLSKSLNTFLQSPLVDKVLVVVSRNHGDYLLSEGQLASETDPRLSFAFGGVTRGESIRNGLKWCLKNLDVGSESRFLVHDSCRPYVSPSLVEQFFSLPRKHYAAWVTVESPGDAIAVTKPSGERHVQVASDGVRALQTPILLFIDAALLVAGVSSQAFTRGLAAFLISQRLDLGFLETDGSTRKITYSYDLIDK